MHDAERHEITQRARETLDRLAAADRQREFERLQRGPVEHVTDQEDALLRWQRLKQQSTEPPKPQPPQPKERHMPDVQLRTQVERDRREALAYREALEKAIGSVIANQRKVDTALRAEIAELRADINREPAELPALRLIGGNDAA